MMNVSLRGHDYNYEIAELIKMFTRDFSFSEKTKAEINKEEQALTGRLINSVKIDGNYLVSRIEYFEGDDLVIAQEDRGCLDPIGCKLIFDGSGLIKEVFSELPIELERKAKKICKDTIKRNFYQVLEKLTHSYTPWGILTGIRPVKVVHNYLDSGLSEEEIRDRLKNHYFIDEEKIDLCLEVAKKERVFIYPVDKNKISLYVSIPFCPTRCLYCSFPSNSLADFGQLTGAYVEKLAEEIHGTAELLQRTGKEIETLYIGGGTPTALSAEELDLVITNLFETLDLSKIIEFTVEAGRPDTITREKLEVLKKHGATRISINPQTMNDITLEKIGRRHKVSDIISCFYLARELGFDNINMDLILGLIDEDLEMVRNTLEEVKKLKPESLTVHTMAVKRASELNLNMEKYRSQMTKDTEIVKMIDLSHKYAREMGMKPYYMYRQKHMVGNLENIGYAKDGLECIYNIQVMEEKQSNYALGAGSISKFVYPDENRIERVANVKNLEQYLDRVEEMVERKNKEVEKNAN
ncbi:MAG: coproporphyrinogen dehydrogenase HemZ [Clostridioides sp.]|nr:coproporphyrinogen dehydrogenase HemZ [Clostridioides sp.]